MFHQRPPPNTPQGSLTPSWPNALHDPNLTFRRRTPPLALICMLGSLVLSPSDLTNGNSFIPDRELDLGSQALPVLSTYHLSHSRSDCPSPPPCKPPSTTRRTPFRQRYPILKPILGRTLFPGERPSLYISNAWVREDRRGTRARGIRRGEFVTPLHLNTPATFDMINIFPNPHTNVSRGLLHMPFRARSFVVPPVQSPRDLRHRPPEQPHYFSLPAWDPRSPRHLGALITPSPSPSNVPQTFPPPTEPFLETMSPPHPPCPLSPPKVYFHLSASPPVFPHPSPDPSFFVLPVLKATSPMAPTWTFFTCFFRFPRSRTSWRSFPGFPSSKRKFDIRRPIGSRYFFSCFLEPKTPPNPFPPNFHLSRQE